MFEDGQYCVIKESRELVRFIGNLNGDYTCELGIIEDAYDSIRVVRLNDIEPINREEAIEFNPVAYAILESYEDRYDE